MSWYVLYTKPRNEKKLAALLEQKGYQVYCPVQETIRQWSDRKKKVIEPVFNSYIFVSLQNYKEEAGHVLSTPGAIRFLFWLKQPGVVRDSEIEAIRNFLGTYRDAAVSMSGVKAGDTAGIQSGPLKNHSGTVIRVQGRKAYLQLESLGWMLVAEVPLHTLGPA